MGLLLWDCCYGIAFHTFANVIQNWFRYRQCHKADIKRQFVITVAAIDSFMFENCLKINTSRTAFLPISRKTQRNLTIQADTGFVTLSPYQLPINLGINVDGKLSFDRCLSWHRKCGSQRLRNIQQPRYYHPTNKPIQLISSAGSWTKKLLKEPHVSGSSLKLLLLYWLIINTNLCAH